MADIMLAFCRKIEIMSKKLNVLFVEFKKSYGIYKTLSKNTREYAAGDYDRLNLSLMLAMVRAAKDDSRKLIEELRGVLNKSIDKNSPLYASYSDAIETLHLSVSH